VTKQARQAWLLIGLFVVFGGVLTYQLWPSDTAVSSSPPSNQKDVAGTPGTLQVATVNLDRLKMEPTAAATAKRDPFRFKPKPIPPPPVRRQPIVQLPPVNPGPPPPPADTRPEISMKYLGYVIAPNGTRMAVLQDNQNHPSVTGKQGDVIDGRYRLLRVDANEVELSYLDGGRRRRIVKGQ